MVQKEPVRSLDAIDRQTLEDLKFKADEPEMPTRTIDIDIAKDLGSSGGRLMSSYEAQELSSLEEAHGYQEASGIIENIGGYLARSRNLLST